MRTKTFLGPLAVALAAACGAPSSSELILESSVSTGTSALDSNTQNYWVTSASSGLRLDIRNSSKENGAVMVQNSSDDDSTSQRWGVIPLSANTFQLVNSNSGKCIVANSIQQGSSLRQATCVPNGTAAQIFSDQPTPDGHTKLRHVASALCADVRGNSTDPNASIVLWACSTALSQSWDVSTVVTRTPGDPNAPADPNSAPGNPNAPADPNSTPGNPTAPADPNTPADPNSAPGNPNAPADPNSAPGNPNGTPGDPNTPADPNSAPGNPNTPTDPNATPANPNTPAPPTSTYCDDMNSWLGANTALENEVMQRVNAARATGYDCGSSGRFAPAPALTNNASLRCAARNHSRDMATRKFFDHTNPDGQTPWDRFKLAGYNNYALAGENIAAGSSTPAAVMTQWLNSPLHCANLMNPKLLQIGVGFFDSAAAPYRYYWTQDFATPLP